jgi:hypothetical protein
MRSALCTFLILIIFPCAVSAQGLLQGINGLLDLNYSFFSSKTTDASGTTTKTETNTYNPRFSLSISTTLFPKLRLDAGGLFEKNISILKTDLEDTKTTSTRFRPYVYLTLSDPLYTAGVGYSRREETTKTEGTPGITLVNDDYLAVLKWKPEGFPLMDTLFERTSTFDEEHLFQDTTKDYFSLTSRYSYRGLDLRYQGAYTDTNQKLNHMESIDWTHSGWVNYSNSFLDRRISLSTSYNINYDQLETSAPGTGTVSIQVFPFAGLSLNTDTPTTGALDPNAALIDGNLTARAGINIGLPPLGGDLRKRNIGLDFVNPTEVNSLLLWVDGSLPTNIADYFTWDIYKSSDNLNWIFVTSVHPAPFGPFQNRFGIDFTNVTARYIKVVTNPLAVTPTTPDASSFPDIFITELQAFLKKPVREVRETTTRTSQIYDLDVKARILDIPTFFYNLNYFYTRVDPEGQLRYTVSNGFSVNHRFSRVFSGNAKVAREDGSEQQERRVAYVYDASLVAVPLKTLTHRLVFSGRDETIGGRNNSNNSIVLYNFAELYKGLEVNLNGYVSFLTNETGERTHETGIQFIAMMIPHRTMNVTLDYKYTNTDRSRGDNLDSSTYSHRGQVLISYNPFRTLFLVASIDVLADKVRKTQTIQNYGVNWSPFPDAALQFRFNYNENLTTGGIRERIINPGVRWNITRVSYLDLSYQFIKSESETQKIDSNFFSATLKIFF